MLSQARNSELGPDLEVFGVPPMDLSQMIVSSSSCSECGTSSLDTTGPADGGIVHARHLLKILRLFHKDHVQSVSGIRDGFLGYHVKNFSSGKKLTASIDTNFNEMGFVYDSVLSKSYRRSYILEIVRVDFNQGRSKRGSELKRSLSLDDLDMIAQKNYQLDKKTLYLLGFDTDRPNQCGRPRAVCDGGHFSESIDCKFSRCTTIIQDDRVVRKLTLLKDADPRCQERESVSVPLCSSVEPLKMVDEYYAMQYAEKLFRRCQIGHVWDKLDFVHRKWLGELVDEESVLVSNILKNVYLQRASHGDGGGEDLKYNPEYNPEYQSLKVEEVRIGRGSSLGSLNNMLVEGLPVFNDTLDYSGDPVEERKKSGPQTKVRDGSAPENGGDSHNTSFKSGFLECTMVRGDSLCNQTINGDETKTCQGQNKSGNLDKVSPGLKTRVHRPTRNKYGKITLCRMKKNVSWRRSQSWEDTDESVSDNGDRNGRAVKSRRSWRGERTKRRSALKVLPQFRPEKDAYGEGDARKPNGLTRGVYADGSKEEPARSDDETLMNFKRKASLSGTNLRSSSSSVSSSATSSSSTNDSSTSKMSEATLSKAVSTKKPVKERSTQQREEKKKKKQVGPNSIIAKVLRLLAKEVQAAQGQQHNLRKQEPHFGKYDVYIQLRNFCVVFKEAEVMRSLLQEEEIYPLTMTEKIVKAIDECKLACLRICKSTSTTDEGLMSSDETLSSTSSNSDVMPDATSRRVPILSDDDDVTGSPSSDSSASTSTSSTPEDAASGAHAQEKVGTEREVEESATTDTIEEETFHTAESFRLQASLAHVGKHTCRCEECAAVFREVIRLMGSDKALKSSSKWSKPTSQRRVVTRRRWLSGVRYTSSPKMAAGSGRLQQVAPLDASGMRGAGRRDHSYEKKKPSKSDGDAKEYMDAPKQQARKFLSLRKMAVARGLKKRPKNCKGTVYKARNKAINCRKSASCNSGTALLFKQSLSDTSPSVTTLSSRPSTSSDATGLNLSVSPDRP